MKQTQTANSLLCWGYMLKDASLEIQDGDNSKPISTRVQHISLGGGRDACLTHKAKLLDMSIIYNKNSWNI